MSGICPAPTLGWTVRAAAGPLSASGHPVSSPDYELDRLAAEARYHRERYDLYRARVISGSSVATSPARLRELERTATAAEERLAHARQLRRLDLEGGEE